VAGCISPRGSPSPRTDSDECRLEGRVSVWGVALRSARAARRYRLLPLFHLSSLDRSARAGLGFRARAVFRICTRYAGALSLVELGSSRVLCAVWHTDLLS